MDNVNGKLIPFTKLDVGGDGASAPVTQENPVPTQEVPQASSLLLRIFNLLMSPMGFDRSLPRQRVTAVVESGTVTTVSTVTTVTPSFGFYPHPLRRRRR